MGRLFILMSVLLIMLAGCGGPSDTSVADPPDSQPFESSESTKINDIVKQWETAVPAEMQKQHVKPETIEQKVYLSRASLQEINDFYTKGLTEKGWQHVQRMPGLQAQEGVLLTGYQSGNFALIIGAVDASKLGGSGVMVYTAKGTK